MQGNLTWNQNGTLQKLAITDEFNSPDTQTCSYLYDDLARIGIVGCGSEWSQTISPDMFGNIKMTGSGSFQPGYVFPDGSTNNQMYSLGGSYPSYDADGNLLNTGTGIGTNTYTWNAFGGMTSDTPSGSATVGIDYDALGREAMTNLNGGSYVEFVYAPGGSIFATMNGQTLSRAQVPLPGGGFAVYNSSGLNRYWHADWQGSIRLTSTTTQTYYTSTAYAPYGEYYAQGPHGLSSPFAGLISETSGELDDALFREYNATQGRWMSPDPAGLAAVDLTNPQSLNRYAYVMNNPTTLVDPSGLDPHPQSCTTMTCAWQYYCGTLYCGYDPTGLITGPGWDEFGLQQIPSQQIVGLQYLIGFDPNGDGPPVWYVAGIPAANLLDFFSPDELQGPNQSNSSSGSGTAGCTTKILGAVNSTFGTSFTSANVGTAGGHDIAFHVVATARKARISLWL